MNEAMGTETRDVGESTATLSGNGRTEAGFLMLALAELCGIFGAWFGFWPAAFGMSTAYGSAFAAFFVASGVVGFYLSFRTLSLA